MRTQLLDCIETAADVLRGGGLVAFPTETVFGLGADARNESAIERLFAAKGRPADNPLIVHLADRDQWPLAARELTSTAAQLLFVYAPGPMTVVLPKNPNICAAATAGLDTVGIRIPSAVHARNLLLSAGIPIAAPSANRSGRPSCTTWRSVLEDLDGRIDAILTFDSPHVGLESTVVDCTGEVPVLLRPGAVSLAELRSHFPNASQLDAQELSAAINSPGLRHAHYQPNARVQLVTGLEDCQRSCVGGAAHAAYCGLDAPVSSSEFRVCRRFGSIEDYARGFYEFLRLADRRGASVVYAQVAPGGGIAEALRDRQLRSAGLMDFSIKTS